MMRSQQQPDTRDGLGGAFGQYAGRVASHYPWPAHADQFTGAYLTAAIIPDGGLFGFGGCATRDLAGTFASTTKVWVYQFDHRTGPGLSPDPAGYVWGRRTRRGTPLPLAQLRQRHTDRSDVRRQ